MYWHIDTDIVSLIVIAAIYVYYRTQQTPGGDPLRGRRFLRCLITGIAVTVIDVVASVAMETPISRFLYHFLMTLYFVSIELIIVEWLLYVLTILYRPGERGEKAIRHVVTAVYAAYAVFNCLNPWTGLVYRLGPNNEYSRGPFFSAMLVLYMSYTLALFLLILIRRKHIPAGYPVGVLLSTPVLIAVGIVTQLTIPGLLTIMPAYMICLVFAFLFLQNMQFKQNRRIVEDLSRVAETDTLTGLYNRTGMEAMVAKTRAEAGGQSVFVMLVDIDDLKRINDTLGHAAGDQAIREVALQLKRHFRACDTVVRYGGDEFLVFLTGAFSQEQLQFSMERLVRELSALRVGVGESEGEGKSENDGGGGGTTLHCSLGAACGVVDRESFETLCSRADIALYFVKRNGKNACAFYRPDMEPFVSAQNTAQAADAL